MSAFFSLQCGIQSIENYGYWQYLPVHCEHFPEVCAKVGPLKLQCPCTGDHIGWTLLAWLRGGPWCQFSDRHTRNLWLRSRGWILQLSVSPMHGLQAGLDCPITFSLFFYPGKFRFGLQKPQFGFTYYSDVIYRRGSNPSNHIC